MRMKLVLSLIAAISLIALLAGCGGGGGGGGNNSGSDNGRLVVDSTVPPQWTRYVTPANREIATVYAICTKSGSTQTVTGIFSPQDETPEYPNGSWFLNLSSNSTQFSGTANGVFNMSVYVGFVGSTTPVRIGNPQQVELSVVGSGPPPPPWP